MPKYPLLEHCSGGPERHANLSMTYVRYGRPGAAPMTPDGPFPDRLATDPGLV